MIPRAAGGGVMNVSSPKFIEPDSTPDRSGPASRPVVRCSIVMSLAPPVETIVISSLPVADPRHHVLEQLRAPARGAVVLAHVQVDDRRARLPPPRCSTARSRRSCRGCSGCSSRNTSAPVGATVTTTGSRFQARVRGIGAPYGTRVDPVKRGGRQAGRPVKRGGPSSGAARQAGQPVKRGSPSCGAA